MTFSKWLQFLAVFLLDHFIFNAVASESSAEQKLALPKADWVHFAQHNTTALVAHALELAKLADLVTLEKVERIERMMNNSLSKEEQILCKGSEALDRLTAEKEDDKAEGNNPKRNGGIHSNCSFLLIALLTMATLPQFFAFQLTK